MARIYFAHDRQESPAARRVWMERAGWQVRATRDAREILRWLETEKPDLVVLDVLLDGLDGFEVCRRIRAQHSLAELPIVLGCHLYQEAEHRSAGEAAGAQVYLTLPTGQEGLLRALDEAIGCARDAAAA